MKPGWSEMEDGGFLAQGACAKALPQGRGWVKDRFV